VGLSWGSVGPTAVKWFFCPMQTSQLAELPQSSDDDDDISLLGGADDPVAKHDTEEWCKPSAFSHCVRHLAFLWNLLFLLLGLLTLGIGV